MRVWDYFSSKRHVHAHVFWSVFISAFVIICAMMALFMYRSSVEVKKLQTDGVDSLAESIIAQVDAHQESLAQIHSVVYSSNAVYRYIANGAVGMPKMELFTLYQDVCEVFSLELRGHYKLLLGIALIPGAGDNVFSGSFYKRPTVEMLGGLHLDTIVESDGYAYYITYSSTSQTYLVSQLLVNCFSGSYLSLVTESHRVTIKDPFGGVIDSYRGADSEPSYSRSVTSETSGITVTVTMKLPSFWQNIAEKLSMLVTACVVLLVISFMLSLGFSMRLKMGFQQMQRNIQAVEDECYDSIKLIEGEDELSGLSRTFKHMAEHISLLNKENVERERTKHELEIQVLRAQVSPHFLHNSLNSVRYLCQMSGMKHIEQLTVSIIKLLKDSLYTDEYIVPIQAELDYVASYCEICRYQVENEFDIDIQVDESAKGLMILHMALQPIVENCILHGFDATRRGKIQIAISAKDDKMHVSVEDNGRGMTAAQLDGLMKQERNVDKRRFSGIGVKNVRDRIRLRFGEEYGLTVSSKLGEYTRVEFALPKIREVVENDTNSAG